MQEPEGNLAKGNKVGIKDLLNWRFLLLATLSSVPIIFGYAQYFQNFADQARWGKFIIVSAAGVVITIYGLVFFVIGLLSMAFKSPTWRNAFFATGTFWLLIDVLFVSYLLFFL